MADTVLTEVSDGVGVLTLNRPEVRNAVDLATTYALAAAVDELEARDELPQIAPLLCGVLQRGFRVGKGSCVVGEEGARWHIFFVPPIKVVVLTGP